MGDSEDPMGINDKIEILSTDDDRIKAVGELLSSDSSRAILKVLFNESLTANQIAQKTEISLPLVMYHLKKMQDTNVVKISQTGKNTKSHDMKYYTVDKFAIVILPSGMSEKAKSSKSLFNSFNRIYRFATIGGVSLAAWFSAQFVQQNNRIAISNARANSGNQIMMDIPQEPALTKSSPEMAMKQAPVPEPTPESTMEAAPASPTEPEVMPIDGDTLSYMTPNAPATGDLMIDLYLSIIIALSVGIIGLIIERIIHSRKK
ncbi:MAG: ArsR family transcriptional regulator [Candidatus Nitrosotenuis sp.]